MPSTTLDVIDRNCLRFALNIGQTIRDPWAYRLPDRQTVQVTIGDPFTVCSITGPIDVVAETLRLAHEAVTDRPLSPITDTTRIDEARAWVEAVTRGDESMIDVGRGVHHVESLLTVIAQAER